MSGNSKATEDDFRGLNFAHIEGDGLAELSSRPGAGWRSFLVFDRRKKRLARLNAIDLDDETKRREKELKFGSRLSGASVCDIYDFGQDDDSLFFVSDLLVDSEPLNTYLKRESPLQPVHGFRLITEYVKGLKRTGKFASAPNGLEFFNSERLWIGKDLKGQVGLIFCGFGGAEKAGDSKASFDKRVSILTQSMGLAFEEGDLPRKGDLNGFLKWAAKFEKELGKPDAPLPDPVSEIRAWLSDPKERREKVCESAPKGMAGLVPLLETPVPEPKNETEKAPDIPAEKKPEEAEPEVVKSAKPEPEKEGPDETEAVPAATGVGEMFERGWLKRKVESGINDVDDDEIGDLLPGYLASRKMRKSPMTWAIVFFTISAALIWLISLNVDVIADSVSKFLGKERKPRSGFEALTQDAKDVKETSIEEVER